MSQIPYFSWNISLVKYLGPQNSSCTDTHKDWISKAVMDRHFQVTELKSEKLVSRES